MNKSLIYNNLNIAYYKSLSPRKRQIIFRRFIKNLIKFIVLIVFCIATIAFLFWLSFLKPSKRDNYENNKNIEWQREVAEYKGIGY